MKVKLLIAFWVVALLCIVLCCVMISTAPVQDWEQERLGMETDPDLETLQVETTEQPQQESLQTTAATEETQQTTAPEQETQASGTQSNRPIIITGNSGGNQAGEPVLPTIQVEPEVPETITFPYTIPNSGLVLQKLDSYDGIYLEDGSDSSVSGIYSAVIKNSGSKDVEFARITLECDGTQLTFELSDLPAGATVVVQEAGKTAYRTGTYQNCSIDLAETDALDQSTGIVSVQEAEDGSLTVTNLTGQAIPAVRVFYKFYMADENVYVGGITYTAKLTDLEAGGSQTIVPSHYSQGYSKVVMIRTYDTSD